MDGIPTLGKGGITVVITGHHSVVMATIVLLWPP